MSYTHETHFSRRHIGIDENTSQLMLKEIGYKDLSSFIQDCVPEEIRSTRKLDLKPALSEAQALAELHDISQKNEIRRQFIGLGYYNCFVPSVIRRCVLENPGWYTQYTPYQAEIAQGRLEALLNFQTMITELTGLDIANASLLDEATAAAEAMTLAWNNRARQDQRKHFLASTHCHPQTLSVLQTRAEPLGIELIFIDETKEPLPDHVFGALFQYPHSNGTIDKDLESRIAELKNKNVLVALATDLLALCLLKDPGSLGADIAVGNSQRFGVPLGFGGPHAAFFAAKDEYKRKVPGRLVGVSKDAHGRIAYRLALQTREQHIRRDKATSNICTSQVLLAIMSSMYAVYHGPQGLIDIANHTLSLSKKLAHALEENGFKLKSQDFFDTICVVISGSEREQILKRLDDRKINVRRDQKDTLILSLDETATLSDVTALVEAFSGKTHAMTNAKDENYNLPLRRTKTFMHQPVFHQHHTEAKMTRYIKSLENKDLSLTHSMIALGSCTMKLNSASSLYPVSWPQFANIHPFAPADQTQGYLQMIRELEGMLAAATGFDAVSLQPNSGAQGEYAGLIAIRRYHQSHGNGHRNICLIPTSAHGTNPASAVMAGMQVVPIRCDDNGNISMEDLREKAALHQENLSAIMITYPSTHGVFESTIVEICKIIHEHGGQVYLDGANLNAQVGLCYPGEYGADVCHLNLHKTFSIPHGGGGPGVGPIAVKQHLAPHIPGHPFMSHEELKNNGPVSAAPYGSAGILCIPWMYIRMLGEEGLRQSTQAAILNANYIAKKLSPFYNILYTGKNGRVAHECIIDLRPFKKSAHIEVEDVAKRLMDYGFHAPTMSWPVAGTFMIEPTESESKEELDRFCEALIEIRAEIDAVARDEVFKSNVLKNAPHTAECISKSDWSYDYTREKAVFPMSWVKDHKYWPPVGRIDNALGDRQLICTCPDMSSYE